LKRAGLILLLAGCATQEREARTFSIPIEVAGLPTGSEFVPVTCFIDFTAVLERLKVAGAVDERSLRLYAGNAEIPFQFSASPQARPKERKLLPGTSPAVSLSAEYAAGETPAGVRVAGVLTWLARGPRYRLSFKVAPEGRLVQVPFPPQNLRAFDAQGRATPVRHFPRMQIRPQWPLDGKVDLYDGRQLVTTYHTGPTQGQAAPPLRRPFFYPVAGPDGIPLTEFGKPHDPTGSHAHHYSLWIAHGSVSGKDFWSERGGMIVHEQFELQEDGPVFGRIVQKTRWVHGETEALRERRTLTLYGGPEAFRVLDVDLELSAAGAAPVTLGKSSFGFLAARVAQSMTPFDGGGEILNARGDRSEHGAHLKRAEWIDQSGPISPGLWGGVAILDHPSNPNHPTGWHCRDDGWAGASLNLDGPSTIEPGRPLKLRYRVVLHRGNAVQGEIARRFEEYASQPAVTLP